MAAQVFYYNIIGTYTTITGGVDHGNGNVLLNILLQWVGIYNIYDYIYLTKKKIEVKREHI